MVDGVYGVVILSELDDGVGGNGWQGGELALEALEGGVEYDVNGSAHTIDYLIYLCIIRSIIYKPAILYYNGNKKYDTQGEQFMNAHTYIYA